MHDITYDYYRIFYYVAKYKSLSRAAEILHSNQPNISKFMNKLEAQLGCKLMIRSNKGIRLTPEGEHLFSHVSIAQAQFREAEEELAQINQLSTGHIRIGATDIALHGILLDTLSKFRSQYPDVHLMIANHSTPQAIASLKKGAVDFAVITFPADVPSEFQKHTLLSFRELLVTAVNHPLARKKEITPEELISHSIVGLGPHSKTYEFYTHRFLEYGLEWHPDIDAATADQILPMIKAGLGIGFLPEFMAREAIAQGEVTEIAVNGAHFERTIVLVEDKSQNLNVAANTLKRLLIQH